ncbi:hypothetical protein PR003_g11839 [Phytophthora rubi]|uniref:ZSWIM1/3 RNaseH-like domain-containing protein n=1 Tax=Phytophthora rubi TaxID=129364 RepID=A0A6A4F1W8_9STRA|nr:hypothetical protein PR003_g11839 [Phytophthora rubi]
MRLNSSELADVNTLRRVGVARKKILKYIWENTDSEPCMVDFHNLLAKLKKEEEAGSTVSERLSETHGVAHVDIDRVDNEAIARCIVLQTTHMRSLFSSFPETILVDATHGTNADRYRLFSFMVHNSFGHGQHVQMVSCYAFYVVKEQYDIAANAGTYYEVREEGNQLYVVASASTTCKVDISTWTSYCMLGVTHKLPYYTCDAA